MIMLHYCFGALIMTDTVTIRFANTNVAKAGQYAETLKTSILDAAPEADVKREKDSQETQDFGATLAIVLAGPAVVAIAKGMQVWLERYRGVELEVTTPDGKVIAKNITAANVVQVIQAAKSIPPKRP
jgi:hypothetical protein